MDKRQLKKLIKNELKDICKIHKFIPKSETLYLRVTDDNVLHVINFDLGSIGFTCSIAIQPLYTIEHTNVVSLNMGGRLSRFKIVQKEWWTYEDPEKGLKEILKLLMLNGLPWFEQFGTAIGIIEFITSGKPKEYGLVSFNPFHQKKYLAFSFLFIGNLIDGSRYINDLIGEIKENATDFMLLYKKQLEELANIINREPEKVPQVLNTAILENKKAIKI